jgi:hypothetical protein
MDDGRVRLGPLPGDVTGMILGALRRKDRIRTILFSKAFYRAFWLRWATKRDFWQMLLGADEDSCRPETHVFWQQTVSLNDALAKAVRGCFLLQYRMAVRATADDLTTRMALHSVFSKHRLCIPTVYQFLGIDFLDSALQLGVDPTDYVGGVCMQVIHRISEGWDIKEIESDVKYSTGMGYAAYVRELLFALRDVKSFRFCDVQDAIAYSLVEVKEPMCAAGALVDHPAFDASVNSAVLAKCMIGGYATDAPLELILRLVRHPTFDPEDLSAETIIQLGSRKGGSKVLREIFKARSIVEIMTHVATHRIANDWFLVALSRCIPPGKSAAGLVTKMMIILVRRLFYSIWISDRPKLTRSVLRLAKHEAFSMWDFGAAFNEMVSTERKDHGIPQYDSYMWLCSNKLIPQRESMGEIARFYLERGSVGDAGQLARFFNEVWMYDFGEEGYDIMEMQDGKYRVPVLEFVTILKEKCPTFREEDYLKHAIEKGWLESHSFLRDETGDPKPAKKKKKRRTHV